MKVNHKQKKNCKNSNLYNHENSNSSLNNLLLLKKIKAVLNQILEKIKIK